MTFGQTLKQLLNISGIKSAHLAAALGYDTSYISRWVNDIKLPSLRGNDDLFEKIAAIIVSGSDSQAIERLGVAYGTETAWLEETLASALKVAYDGSASPSAHIAANPNAMLLHGSGNAGTTGMYSDAILRALEEADGDSVDFFTTTPLELYSNKNMRFWDEVLSAPGITDDVRITVHQIVDMEAFSKNIDTYCSTICTLSKFDPRVRYEFYVSEDMPSCSPGYITAIGENLMCWILYSGISPEPHMILCNDRAVLRRFMSGVHAMLPFRPKLLSFLGKDELEKSHFLYDFVMSGSLRYLLYTMHPIYIDDAFARDIASRYLPELANDDFQMYYNSLCSNAKREVILYRSALLEYIYSGHIFLFGREMQLEREDRAVHLKQLLENMRSGACQLKILNDDNPLLSRRDTHLSVYLSRSGGFMAGIENDWYASIKISSQKSVEYFNTFFTHLFSLDGEYMLSGAAAEEFIERGLELM